MARKKTAAAAPRAPRRIAAAIKTRPAARKGTIYFFGDPSPGAADVGPVADLLTAIQDAASAAEQRIVEAADSVPLGDYIDQLADAAAESREAVRDAMLVALGEGHELIDAVDEAAEAASNAAHVVARDKLQEVLQDVIRQIRTEIEDAAQSEMDLIRDEADLGPDGMRLLTALQALRRLRARHRDGFVTDAALLAALDAALDEV